MTAYIPAGAPLATDSHMAFQLHTSPEPVRVSPSTGDTEYAKISLVASVTGQGAITLDEITVKVLAGADSPHFASSLSGARADIDRPGWEYNRTEQSTFFFMPSSGSGETVNPGAGMTLTIDRIPVNKAIGSSQVTVTARWNNGSGTDRTIFEVGKFPSNFYLRDFAGSHAEVGNGESVELRWQASAGAALHLMYEDVQHDVTGRSEFTVTNMRRTTVFYLRGSHGTAEQTLGTIVGIADPDLEVNNLVVTADVRTDRLETRTVEQIHIAATPPAPTAVGQQRPPQAAPEPASAAEEA